MGDDGVTIHWSNVICKEPGHYLGWPTIARKDDGELLVAFSGDREAHRCPYGKNEMIRSQDGGETWSKPATVNSSPMDDRDTGLLALRSGSIVMSWFTGQSWRRSNLEPYWEMISDDKLDSWRRHVAKLTEETVERWHGHWTRRSTDGGHTWEPAVDSIATTPHGPIELKDGRLLFVGNAEIDGHRALVAVASTDEARSWHLIGTVPVPAEHAREVPYHEPHVVELADGRLVTLWRFQPNRHPVEHHACHIDTKGYCVCGKDPEEHYMQQSESVDGGITWSQAHPTPIWGYPPHLVRLHDDTLLASYGVRRVPYGQRACLSHDGGKTWDIENEIVLRDDAPDGNLGYPASLELEPGELMTVYYQVDEPGEKTSIMATRWSLKP